MLIVLDNAATAEQVRPLLPGSGSCAVVVTSRDRLAGLVSTHGARRLGLDLLPAGDAMTLLHRLVGYRVDAEPDAAATLAEQCARLPLALRVAAELAVTRHTAPLADLVVELTDQQRRLDLLAGSDDRYASVKAVFSWSVQHLPPDAAKTFRRLGVHPGPDIDPYATAALAGTGPGQARHTLDLLARAHLMHSTGPGRYAMHDLLRAYAANLTAIEDPAQVRRAALDRLFDYYVAAAAAAMDGWYPAESHRRPRIASPASATPVLSDPAAARAWLNNERPCLVAAAAHTATHGWTRHTAQLSSTLFRYLAGGYYGDALAIHGHACHAARQAGDRAGQAYAFRGLGAVYGRLGQYQPAADHHRRALALFRQIGDALGEAIALDNLGSTERRLGRYRPAADHHRQALALFRQSGDQVGEANALNNLGVVEERLGQYAPAADRHRQALALFRQVGDGVGEAGALNNLANAESRLGQHATAKGHHQAALALTRRLRHPYGEAAALDSLGLLWIDLGQAEQAAEHLEQALVLSRELGDRSGEVWALNGLGEAAQLAERPHDAVAYHTNALTVATIIDVRDQQARAHAGLGQAHAALGDHAGARTHFEWALGIYTELAMPAAGELRDRLAART
jgi:tetratricopeptide (TPR) repeat protein